MILGSDELTYDEMLTELVPRPISDEQEYQRIQQHVDQLIDKGELSSDEEDILELLGGLIYFYEERVENKASVKAHGVELLIGLLELYDYQQHDVSNVFATEAEFDAVVSRRAPLTIWHANQLAQQFCLPAADFLERTADGLLVEQVVAQ